MLTTDRGVQLDELLDASISDFDIPAAVHERAVARYGHVGDWLSEYWTGSAGGGDVYPQGSFRLGTVVQPIDPRDDYDIDLVCRRDISKGSTTQELLKTDVGNALRSYVATGPDGKPQLREGKRCWALEYPAEPFHMDVLPAVPDREAAPNGILLTDRELRRWQHSNPIDYASWFQTRMAREFREKRAAVAQARKMDVEDVPEWQVKTTLQRTVQALKRHRDSYFAENAEDRPASIIITTLAARAYTGSGSLHDVLVDVTATMPTLVERRDGVWWVENPVQPEENFADRWRAHPGRDRLFFEWIARAHTDFAGFGSERGVDRVLTKIAGAFGERPAKSAGALFGSALADARDRGRLGMAGGTGLLSAAAVKPIPRHTFHGDAPSDRA
jgi:hypothetical protein